MKKLGVEDYILLGICLLVVVMLLYVMAGCATSQKVSDFDILWSDGECIFHAKGMSLEQAQDLQHQWNFENCDVRITDTEKDKGVNP